MHITPINVLKAHTSLRDLETSFRRGTKFQTLSGHVISIKDIAPGLKLTIHYSGRTHTFTL